MEQSEIDLFEQLNELIAERDETRKWMIAVSGLMNIKAKESETVLKSWAMLREDILNKMRELL